MVNRMPVALGDTGSTPSAATGGQQGKTMSDEDELQARLDALRHGP